MLFSVIHPFLYHREALDLRKKSIKLFQNRVWYSISHKPYLTKITIGSPRSYLERGGCDLAAGLKPTNRQKLTLFSPNNLWRRLRGLLLLLLLLSRFSRVRLCATPTDGSPPGSPVPGILQARTLEWVAISFSSAWKWKVKVKSLSRVRLLATPWTAAHQAPPSMGFSRQAYWSGVPLPSPLYHL